jgi:hypothetical protein
MLTRLIAALSLTLAVPCAASAQAVRLGLHYGVNVSNGRFEDPRLGAQGSVHLVGPLEVAGAFSVLTNWPDIQGFTGSAWFAASILRVRPRGPWSFLSAGYGLILLHSSLHNPAFQVDTATTQSGDAMVLGLEVPTPYARPFLDVYLINVLNRGSELGFGVNLLLGVQVPLPLHRST